MPTNRFTLRSAVYLVLIKNNQILMLQRAGSGYHDGDYGLASGHIDGNETARQAMCREALEEVGVTVTPESLQLVHVMHRKMEKDIEYVDFYFSPLKWSGDPAIKEPHKCSVLNWFSLDKLPKNIVPDVEYALGQINMNQVYSEYFKA